MTDTTNYLSQAKFDELTEELNTLINVTRAEIASKIEYARSLGDLSENAEYHDAREEQGKIEARIKELQAILQDVQIVKQHHADVVEVGASVTVQRKGEKDKKTFEIVGSEEADMASGKISLRSPLGQAMMGKKKGESFTFETPTGKKIEYKVMKID